MLTTKTISQAFISRANVHVMCLLPNVSSGCSAFHKQCLCIRHEKLVTHLPCLYVHMHVHVCVYVFGCVCLGEGSAGSHRPGRLLYYFWEGCPFPLEGLIEERWLSPSPPLRLRESGQARPSRLAGCRSSTQPRWSCGLYTAQHPRHCSTHRWLDRLLAAERYIFTGVQQVDQGDPTPALKTYTQCAAVLYPCVCSQVSAIHYDVLWCSISWQHSAPATLENKSASIVIPGQLLFPIWTDQASGKPQQINLHSGPADVSWVEGWGRGSSPLLAWTV